MMENWYFASALHGTPQKSLNLISNSSLANIIFLKQEINILKSKIFNQNDHQGHHG